MIVSDLDGSLLNKHHQVDQKIIDVVKKVIDARIVFVVATGRPLYQDHNHLEFDGYPVYRISKNGAQVHDPSFKTLYQECYTFEELQSILTELSDIHFHMVGDKETWVFGDRETYVDNNFHFNIKTQAYYQEITPSEREEILSRRTFVSDIKQALKEKVYKINCHIKDETKKKELDEFLENHPTLVNTPFKPGFYEIMPNRINKANAIEFLATHLNIKQDEIIVFGDGNNDLEMLKRFKSYAPLSGTSDAKQMADEVIGHYHDYAVIEKILELITGL